MVSGLAAESIQWPDFAICHERAHFIRTQLPAGNILEQPEAARLTKVSAIVFLQMKGAAFWAVRVNGQIASFNPVALEILRLVDNLAGQILDFGHERDRSSRPCSMSLS